MQRIAIDEAFFSGAISLETGDGWIRPWRLPFDQGEIYAAPEALYNCCGTCGGIRVRFESSSEAVGLVVVPTEDERQFDLTIEGKLIESVALAGGEHQVVFDGLPGDEKTVEIWLPQRNIAEIRSILVDDGASATVVPDDRKRWTTYGSSITHCGGAYSPSRTWPAIVARAKEFDLTCLGYGGQCHVDSMIAKMIRDRPADFISLKLGINVYGHGSLNARSFKPAVIGMVRTIREKQPEVPIALISAIISPPRETTENVVGFTLEAMRDEVKDAADRLIAAGDKNLYYFDGQTLFGEDLVADYLPDNLHPNGNGYEKMAENFMKVVFDTIAV